LDAFYRYLTPKSPKKTGYQLPMAYSSPLVIL